jgi:predicted  nucleic acid-binding Zn-ribbon protein
MSVKGYDRVLELQELDLSMDRLENRRRALESGEEIAGARTLADQAEERVGELRMALDSVQREEKRLDGEAASLDARIAAEEKRLYDGSVANPKELSAIQAEITNLRARKSRLEDQELDQMERRDDMEERLPGLEAQLKEAQGQLAELEISSERELADIAAGLEQRRGERQALIPEMDEELLELYEDLRAQKRGVGAAALRDGVCQGCHEKLSALALDRLKREDGVRRCEYCRRILVLE